MHYPKELFDLNFAFVDKVSQILERPWPELLLHYTHTFRRFRLGAALDPQHPVWLQFLEGVRQAQDPAAYAFQFYLERERLVGPLQRRNAFGCFSYALEGSAVDLILRLHFTNIDSEGGGPLNSARQSARLAELAEMFKHARQQLTSPCNIVGESWLYNLPAYQRLFPPAFIATLAPQPPDFPMLSLWGQFLDHHGQVRSDLARTFRERIERAGSMEDLQRAFPYCIYRAAAPVEIFYAFYGLV